MIRIKAVAVIVMGVLALSAVVFAAEKTARRSDRPANSAVLSTNAPDRPLRQFFHDRLRALGELRDELGVTDEQQAAIRGVVKEHRTELVQCVKDLTSKRRALRQAVTAQTPDEAAIRAAADELGKAIGNTAVEASKVIGQVKGHLTPEQLEILRQHRAEREAAVDTLLDAAG